MINKGYLKIENLKMMVLDEADELFKADFQLQIRAIYELAVGSDGLQTLFFSATYSQEDLNVVSNISPDPIIVDMRSDEHTLQGVKQYLVCFERNFGPRNDEEARVKEVCFKVSTLMAIIAEQKINQMLVFIRRKKDANIVADILKRKGYNCDCITADLEQEERETVIEEFRKGTTRILVASDILKRGVDFQGLSMVICLDVPPYDSRDIYFHRVGRTGRYGRRGTAIHIVNSSDLSNLLRIAGEYKSTIDYLPDDFKFSD
ncbi:IF4A [Hepatospora eriocheir]|uniref:RNA helicase n=1 Tax=Hepatospora eriocheir TaxID=1081669 RepID=A0A1X0QH71_9MICR|nr:IF4A [Hepatospora eriocheir]